MRLYHSPTSPFVRKVMVLLIETGQADAVTIVPSAGNPLDPGTMPVGLNPLGKIPCLELDDGSVLYDSRVICRYLDDRAGGMFYPAAPALWQTLTLEATADGMLDAAVLARYETHVRPAASQSPEWGEAQWAKVERALDVLENRWEAHLNGALDMGQLAVACALGYLDFRFGHREWRAGRPALGHWFAGMSARPSIAATVPAG
ncbi:MAG: glutathione S-transferase [Pseudomonadota bacterium]|jgi:glutathione S-transferase